MFESMLSLGVNKIHLSNHNFLMCCLIVISPSRKFQTGKDLTSESKSNMEVKLANLIAKNILNYPVFNYHKVI